MLSTTGAKSRSPSCNVDVLPVKPICEKEAVVDGFTKAGWFNIEGKGVGDGVVAATFTGAVGVAGDGGVAATGTVAGGVICGGFEEPIGGSAVTTTLPSSFIAVPAPAGLLNTTFAPSAFTVFGGATAVIGFVPK